MEAVLHIEPVTRHISAPLNIGHTDYIFYGEQLGEDGENYGSTACSLPLGCPLATPDVGSTQTNIPLVKTVECTPDPSRNQGFVYSETLHYFKDNKYLIPFRSKLHTGMGHGLRISHLPSLNAARTNIAGIAHPVCDPRSEIINDIMLRDQGFVKLKNTALENYISDDLSMMLSRKTTNEMSLDISSIETKIQRFINQLHRTPHDLSVRNLKDINSIIAPEIGIIPVRYYDESPLEIPLRDFKHRLIPHQNDFRSLGRIQTETLHRIEYNPFQFRDACELLDRIPLTDFNVDLVVTPEGNISFFHEHFSLNRFGGFIDNDSGAYSSESILKDFIASEDINRILQKFVQYHDSVDQEIEDLICYNSVKIKLIKTMSDEAAILLYAYNSQADDPPLCGVYFDIALQSLAPMSIIPEPVAN